MRDPVETSELLAFARTVDARSLSRAAAELGVPRATISRRLARLEARLGARLLRRTTRSLSLTDAGEALYRHAGIVLEAVRNAEQSVRRVDEQVRGDLRVSVPPLQDRAFYEMLTGFARDFPEVRLHVQFSTAHVDLQRDGFDVALRASSEPTAGVYSRALARSRLVAVASPAYLAAHGTPRTRRDLDKHRCLMGFARGELPQTHWPLHGGGKLHVDGAFFTNEVTLLAHAASNGLGIALLPLQVVGPMIESGALVPVLPGVLEAEGRISVVYVEREFVPPPVRAFVERVSAWAKVGLLQVIPKKVAGPASRSPSPAAR